MVLVILSYKVHVTSPLRKVLLTEKYCLVYRSREEESGKHGNLGDLDVSRP